MRIEFADGREITKRVIVGVLENETIINPFHDDEEAFSLMMAGDFEAGNVKSLRLEGPGLKYYAGTMKVKFSEIIPHP